MGYMVLSIPRLSRVTRHFTVVPSGAGLGARRGGKEGRGEGRRGGDGNEGGRRESRGVGGKNIGTAA